MDDKEVLKEAIEHWGSGMQIMMLFEEMGELQTALTHYMRNRIEAPSVEEEIADVQVMLNQMKIIFDEENIQLIYEEKLRRLDNMIKYEKHK